ncbi:MAG: glycosyltransferase family 39 protein [Candidatus Omnitrophica bacterium]|nr:glycosyltransferase family 39 protein [Candidatus Omnitrophota bacterium]MBU1869540.1 glycosyltransferase family 39 protein [Candidatus Omnitrophota bacterium]
MKKDNHLKWILILVLLSWVYFILGNSFLSLTNPDEVFYSGTAKEMIKHRSWLVPYLFDEPQFEKPILTYIFLRLSFLSLGLNNFAARFVPAIFALIGVIAAYFLGFLAFKDKKKAFLCGLILMSSGLYVGMARTVFTDMVFTVFISLSLVSFYWAYVKQERKSIGIILFFAFAALSVLTKGPIGFMISAITVVLFLAIRKDLKFIACKEVLWGFLVFIVIAVPWYALMIKEYGSSFTHEFFYNDHIRRIAEAEHAANDTWYFYPATLIGCMFPWSLFVIVSLCLFFRRLFSKDALPIYSFLACWIAAVFIIFQPAHSKLVSYIMPAFAAAAVLTADVVYEAIIKNKRFLITLAVINAFILLAAPAGLIYASNKYAVYITSKAGIYGLVVVFIILILAMLYAALKRRIFMYIYVLLILLPLMLGFVFYNHAKLDPYTSSEEASAYLLKNYKVNNTILCSKFFARGVRFFTEKPVAVINVRGTPYFSPHPTPYFDTDEGVVDFLKKQRITYCILKKGALADLERLVDKESKLEVLKVIGDEHVVRIEIK